MNWVGIKAGGYIPFKSDSEPVQVEFQDRYAACWGPFPTWEQACVAAKHGQGNPHMATVHDVVGVVRWWKRGETGTPQDVNNAVRYYKCSR